MVGINLSGDTTTPFTILTFILLTISGAIVIYSLWIVLIALTFWFTKFDNNVTILQALLDARRYPVTVYPVWLRILVTFIVPIAVATTIPLQALRGERAAVLAYLADQIGKYPAPEANAPDYAATLQALTNAVDALVQAVRTGNADMVRAAFANLKPAYSRMFIKFG